MGCTTPKLSLPLGVSGPHLIWFHGPTQSTLQAAARSVRDQQTDTQTDHAIPSVAIGRIPLLLWRGLKIDAYRIPIILLWWYITSATCHNVMHRSTVYCCLQYVIERESMCVCNVYLKLICIITYKKISYCRGTARCLCQLKSCTAAQQCEIHFKRFVWMKLKVNQGQGQSRSWQLSLFDKPHINSHW